jgi:hypothetical protein
VVWNARGATSLLVLARECGRLRNWMRERALARLEKGQHASKRSVSGEDTLECGQNLEIHHHMSSSTWLYFTVGIHFGFFSTEDMISYLKFKMFLCKFLQFVIILPRHLCLFVWQCKNAVALRFPCADTNENRFWSLTHTFIRRLTEKLETTCGPALVRERVRFTLRFFIPSHSIYIITECSRAKPNTALNFCVWRQWKKNIDAYLVAWGAWLWALRRWAPRSSGRAERSNSSSTAPGSAVCCGPRRRRRSTWAVFVSPCPWRTPPCTVWTHLAHLKRSHSLTVYPDFITICFQKLIILVKIIKIYPY